MARVLATLHFDWRDLLGDRPDPVVYGVGHDREIFAVARSPREKPRAKFQYLVAAVRDDDVRTMHVADRLDVSHVQPIGSDVLLAAARGMETNAVIVGWDGARRSALTLGDGIQDLNVTSDREIWTSFFDEGVFGGANAMGGVGLIAFDANGAIRFAYDAKVAGTDFIFDAYAATITDDGATWVYFYSQFPIVRIERGEYRAWKYGSGGAAALAIHRDHALLIGDYDDRARARVVHLQRNGETKVVNEFDVTDDDGQPLRDARVVGRGSDVFFFRQRHTYLLADWWFGT